MTEVSEVRSLQRNLDKLSRTINPVVLSTALFSEEIIDLRAWDEARKEGSLPQYDRSLSLMGEVMRRTEASPRVFEQFCKILERESVTAGLAVELRACSNGLKTCSERSHFDLKDIGKDNLVKESDLQQQRPPEDTISMKQGDVTGDKLLMDVAWEVGGKWEELGVNLGLDYMVVQNAVSSAGGKPDHMKAFYILQEWKKRNVFKATHRALAKALEESGLNSCAQKYCYIHRF